MNLSLSPEQFAAEGVALVRGLVPESLLGVINSVLRAQAARVMAALGHSPIGIGSRNGYHELVQRSPGRFDVPMHEQDLVPIWGAQGSMAADVPWLGLVRAVLGPELVGAVVDGQVEAVDAATGLARIRIGRSTVTASS